uniref:Uncharacterized protein n=1 Tax=Aegilops tauschii TaxID=37682 RepID=R7W1W8_AEGTA
MDGGGELGITKKEAEAEYHCHDFEWEDLRADVEANPSFSYHLSPFPTITASPQPPSSEAWRSFHRCHASGKFFKEYELDRIRQNELDHIGREMFRFMHYFFIGQTTALLGVKPCS